MRCLTCGLPVSGMVFMLFVLVGAPQLALALPKWVENPPQDNTEFIYGIGSGQDFEAAKLAAQNDIAAKIEVTVSSQTALYQASVNGESSEAFSKQVLANVKALPLGQMQLQKTKTHKKVVWVLMALARNDFKNYQQSQLLIEDREVSRLAKTFNTLPSLQRWPLFDPIKAEISKARARLAAMTALSDFSAKRYEDRYKQYLDNIAKTAANTLLFVKTSGVAEEQALAEVVADLASNEGLLSTTESDKGATGVLSISSTLNKSLQDEAHSARVTVVLTLLDSENQMVASNDFYGTGRSYQSEADAVKRAYQAIATRLKREGLVKALSLKPE